MHQGLPEKPYKEVRKMFDSKTGNPVGDGWKIINTACPLTCFQIIQHWLMRSGDVEMGRCYPKWSPAQPMGKRKAKWKPRIKYQKDDIGMKSIHKVRFEFIDAQGANPDKLKMCPQGGRHLDTCAKCTQFQRTFPSISMAIDTATGASINEMFDESQVSRSDSKARILTPASKLTSCCETHGISVQMHHLLLLHPKSRS